MPEVYATNRATLLQYVQQRLAHEAPPTVAAVFNTLFHGAASAFPIDEDDLYLLRSAHPAETYPGPVGGLAWGFRPGVSPV